MGHETLKISNRDTTAQAGVLQAESGAAGETVFGPHPASREALLAVADKNPQERDALHRRLADYFSDGSHPGTADPLKHKVVFESEVG